MNGGQAYNTSSIAIGGFDEVLQDYNWAMGKNTVAIGGRNNVASGDFSFATGDQVVASGSRSFAVGSLNLSKNNSISPIDTNGWSEEAALFEVGNGNPTITPVVTSNAITTRKNGQTTITNKAWKNRNTSTVTATADPSTASTDATGEALVVEGHTRLKGKVVIEAPQGDISMGIYE